MESNTKRKEEVELGAASTELEPVAWRRRCGCLRTSEKLRQILRSFPAPPPPTPTPTPRKAENRCVVSYCQQYQPPQVFAPPLKKSVPGKPADPYGEPCCVRINESVDSKSWRVVFELVQLVQLSVTATALALYYLIYCYMQLVYYTLKSALYFHQADGPMKITIGVMTLTSLVVGFNIVMRIEKITGRI